ncbi:MAG: trypsin-like peptidase domain-containing protein [Ferruginibacter sp.]|nr:trypsin-like peptidase domain-containing protein [Cytophagales bacterium]
MNKRQFFLGLLLASVTGGLVAIAGFRYFLYDETDQSFEQKQNVRFSSYLNDSSVVVPVGLNFIYAADMVRSGVVHVKTSYDANGEEAMDEVYKDFHGFGNGQPFRNPGSRESAGSGVIISSDGYIATNNHVVENANRIEVVLEDKRSFKAEVVGTDPTTDLALLKVDANALQFVRYGNFDRLKVGEWVLAIGNPFDLTSTVTAGIVSAKGRDIHILKDQDGMQVESFIQTDAAVNPGNSGGALVNLKGELIGINTAIATQTGYYSGYSFAVPVTLVKKVMEDLLRYGEVQRGMLGVQINEVTSELMEEKGLESTQGVYIAGVNQGDAADRGGIQPGDVVTKIDDSRVNAVSELQGLIATHRPGDKVKVTYVRKGREISTVIVLKNRKGSTTVLKREEKTTSRILGADLRTITEEEQGILGIDGGVKVVRLGSGRIKDAGIREGFVITKITRSGSSTPQAVGRPEDISRVIEQGKESILVEGLYPDGNKSYYAISQ